MSKPVAIITGGASGIGLAVTTHLLTRNYRVVIADVNTKEGERVSAEFNATKASSLPEATVNGDTTVEGTTDTKVQDAVAADIETVQEERTLFVRTDVSNYADQANLFATAFKWGGGRLDFFAANAGIDDRQALFPRFEAEEVPLDDEGKPKPLNVKTLDVDLNAVVQGIWLFKYYAGKTNGQGKTKAGGKIVCTSSAAGLYPMDTNPQYCAAKHALVGLTRSIGPPALATTNITVNAILPAFIMTNLCPPHIRHIFPKEHITPMSTIIRAFDTFLDDDSMTGQTVECTLGEHHFRQPPEWANASQKWMGEDSDGFWAKAYERTAPARNGV